jgi:hypothetical protein
MGKYFLPAALLITGDLLLLRNSICFFELLLLCLPFLGMMK